MNSMFALAAALGAAVGWVLLGLAALVRPGSTRWSAHGVFPLGAVLCAVLAIAGLLGVFGAPQQASLALGASGLVLRWRLDALSGFFLLLIGASSLGSSVFASGYFRDGEGAPPGQIACLYHLFLAAMALVVLAADAFGFLLAWELMAVASYLLVLTRDDMAEVRDAGFLYILMAHLGGLCLLLMFTLLAHAGAPGPQDWLQGLSFDAMRQAQPAPWVIGAATLLAVLGFGAKAGLVPLHAWLPEAHPAAPSPVSALMSAVMLKTAMYALLRVSLDLLHLDSMSWGLVLLSLGLASALGGALHAAVQDDMKRLLAYSSIENMGVAFAAFGLTLVFRAAGMPALAALALAGMLFHLLHHSMVKNLLFLATGSVMHATSQRSLGRLGGLLARMPWVGWPALAATLAMAGLPLFGGFVAEWLLLQAFVQAPGLPQALLGMCVALGAALLVLVAALAAYVMVKFYGVVFLGRPREPGLLAAHDPGWAQRAGLLWLAAAGVATGLFPGLVLRLVRPVEQVLLGVGVAPGEGWSRLAPMSAQRATFDPLALVFLGLLLTAAGVLAARAWRVAPARRAALWACGEAPGSPRMQDSAEGFGQPVRRLFAPFFDLHVQAPSPRQAQPVYRESVADPVRSRAYEAVARGVLAAARLLGRVQQLGMAGYLILSFGTLLLLLLGVLR
ncbi:MAG: hydrogenase 4 subunit B [Betaproteobacteria bacterium]|nr:hydrogenase 4 subunit B [Betaproteobacteria bacterium]